jgi:AcrR family transcriptional regulator
MSTRGEQTKELILAKASRLFNEHGYSGASLSDVMKATGLQKGGLYNHFQSKEDLALEAFEYAVKQTTDRFAQLLAGKNTAPERLAALLDGFQHYYDRPPVPGGCPIMNTAIDTDDSNPRLRERARKAMDEFLHGIAAIVRSGIKRKEIRADVDPKEVATILLTLFEGGLMMSKLHGNSSYLKSVTEHMRRYVRGLIIA